MARTIEILEQLAELRDGVSVTELADNLKVGKPMVSRILATLASAGYVRKEPSTDRYALTFKVLALGQRYSETAGFPEVTLPILRRLARESGDLVQLGVVEGDGVHFVAKAEGNQPIRMLSYLGRQAPLHASSIGKVWLASLSDNRALAVLARSDLRRFTNHTITSIDRLLAELGLVRERGYATCVEEILEGAAAVGMAISVGTPPLVVGGVSIAGPIFRMTAERLGQLAELLRPATLELGAIWPRETVQLSHATNVTDRGAANIGIS